MKRYLTGNVFFQNGKLLYEEGEREKEVKKKLEEDPINMDDEDDWDD